jgi:hypothetical protein
MAGEAAGGVACAAGAVACCAAIALAAADAARIPFTKSRLCMNRTAVLFFLSGDEVKSLGGSIANRCG